MLLRSCILSVGVCAMFAVHGQEVSRPVLESGQYIPNGSKDGVGYMSLPFYHGYAMGAADVTGNGVSDLFLQGTNAGGRGIFLYCFKAYSENGTPIFDEAVEVAAPFEDKGRNRGVILQREDGEILGFWRFGTSLRWSVFDRKTLRFSPLNKINIQGIPKGLADFGVVHTNGQYRFFFSVRKEGVFGPRGDWPRLVEYTPEGFWPYGGLPEVGIYTATIDDIENQASLHAQALTDRHEAYYSFDGFARYDHDPSTRYILSGTRFGNIHAYQLNPDMEDIVAKQFLVDADGIRHRNPDIHASVTFFKGNAGGAGLITVGVGGIYYYSATGRHDPSGNPVFGEPKHVLQTNPLLYGGSLVVPNIVDWDGDGLLDMVSGTSSGYIFFFKNHGTNAQPLFADPVKIKAGGEDIHIQAGYRGSIQGYQEARWGYTCPNVVDWNGDGLPDILLGDIRGKFTVYLNEGTKTAPNLAPARPLFHKGLDVYGSWRVRPGVGLMGEKMAYIIMDKDDDFHLYWKLDDYNLQDGGKLTIGDSIPIHGSRLPGGAVGRSRIEIVDWDGDGKKDLLVGTYGKQSIPEPKKGFPFHMPGKGRPNYSTILFLRNSGTNERPVYEYPVPLKFKDKLILFGGHECAPATGYIGSGDSLNLVVGEEGGRYMFYERKDLTW